MAMTKDDKKKAGAAFAVLGLAALGAFALTRQAKASPGEEPGESAFIYISDLILVRTDIPTLYDISWEVSVENIGEGAGSLHLYFGHRMDYACGMYDFSGWKGSTVTVTIPPGETRTFGDILKLNPYCYEIKVESEAGEIVKYWSAAGG